MSETWETREAKDNPGTHWIVAPLPRGGRRIVAELLTYEDADAICAAHNADAALREALRLIMDIDFFIGPSSSALAHGVATLINDYFKRFPEQKAQAIALRSPATGEAVHQPEKLCNASDSGDPQGGRCSRPRGHAGFHSWGGW